MDAVTVTAQLPLKPEAAEAFGAHVAEMIKDTATQPGFISIRVLRQRQDPTQLLLLEQWRSEADYHNYIAWRTGRGDMAAMAAALAGPPNVQIWPDIIAAA